jgi:hypothetical protein
MAEVMHALEQAGVTISSIVTLHNPGGVRQAVIRIATVNPGPAVAALPGEGLRRPGFGLTERHFT